MRNLDIAFIDIFGVPYNGETLSEKGLGGSESAVICMSNYLAERGHNVTVFNNCSLPGKYFDVNYTHYNDIQGNFDVVISSRTVAPFLSSEEHRNKYNRGFILPRFNKISSKYKALWRHDTYVDGDELTPWLVENKLIDEIYTLTPWHTNHFSTNFPVPKENIWQTRNGFLPFKVDTRNKVKGSWIFCGAAYKGLVPLLENFWPKIRGYFPNDKLTVIGGYYAGIKDDNFENYNKYKDLKELRNLGVSFTGVVPQRRVASIMAKSEFMIYPCTFPETFGISTIEAIAYKCIPIVIPEGGLDTVADQNCCIRTDMEHFLQSCIQARLSPYMVEEKLKGCEKFDKDYNSWRAVAKEWHGHFMEKLNG